MQLHVLLTPKSVPDVRVTLEPRSLAELLAPVCDAKEIKGGVEADQLGKLRLTEGRVNGRSAYRHPLVHGDVVAPKTDGYDYSPDWFLRVEDRPVELPATPPELASHLADAAPDDPAWQVIEDQWMEAGLALPGRRSPQIRWVVWLRPFFESPNRTRVALITTFGGFARRLAFSQQFDSPLLPMVASIVNNPAFAFLRELDTGLVRRPVTAGASREEWPEYQQRMAELTLGLLAAARLRMLRVVRLGEAPFFDPERLKPALERLRAASPLLGTAPLFTKTSSQR